MGGGFFLLVGQKEVHDDGDADVGGKLDALHDDVIPDELGVSLQFLHFHILARGRLYFQRFSAGETCAGTKISRNSRPSRLI